MDGEHAARETALHGLARSVGAPVRQAGEGDEAAPGLGIPWQRTGPDAGLLDDAAASRPTETVRRWLPRLRAAPESAVRAGQVGLIVVFAALMPWRHGVLRLLGDDVVYPVVVALTAVLFGCAARREWGRRAAAAGWSVLALAWLLAGAADVATAGHPPRVGSEVSGADGLLIAYFPLVLIGAWLLLRDRTPRWLPGVWWTGVIVGLGALAVGLAVVDAAAPPFLGLPGLPMRVGAFIVADVVLLAATLAIAAVGGARLGPALWLVTMGLGLDAAGDLAGLLQSMAGTYRPGGPVDLLLLVAVAVSGAASVAAVPDPRPDRRQARLPVRPRPGLVPASLVVVCLGLVAWGLAHDGLTPWATYPALACVVASLLRLQLSGWEELRGTDRPSRGNAWARTDDVTGLANRRAVAEALSGGARGSLGPMGWTGWTDRIALLLVDLDRFKDTKDLLGLDGVDTLLSDIGTRLRTVLRPNQMLARLGGDEFAVVLPGADRHSAKRVASAVQAALTQPLEVSGTLLDVSATVGVATARVPRDNPSELLRQADAAMQRAKLAGSGIEIYDPFRDADGSHARLQRISELREALERGDLEVHLQPQVDLRSGAVVGVEALARWRHPQDGVLLPDAFLPLAAQTGLMGPVARLVLDRSLAACATWWAAVGEIPVSVNLSAPDLRDPQLPDDVASSLSRHCLPGRALHIEITEQALLTDPAGTAQLLERWRMEGIEVSLDDYGTGYSSLAYLRELPVDEVKLDRVFAADVGRRRTATIVRHTVAMAHGLGLRVVAEGVEDEQAARLLAELGCDVGQGLYFGAVMGIDALTRRLRPET